MSIIIGIDPGPVRSAAVAFDCAAKRVLWHTCTRGESTEPNQDVLCRLYRAFDREATLVIETPANYGNVVGATILETAYWVGRFAQAWDVNQEARWRWPSQRLYATDVRRHLCGVVAGDARVAQALKDRFGEKGTKKRPGVLYGLSGHAWDALALIVAYKDGVRSELRGIE